MRLSRFGLASLALVALAVATPVSKGDMMSFTYSDLDGDFSHTTSIFTAVAQSGVLGTDTDGDVSRLISPVGTASFDFADAGIGSADFDITMTVSAITSTTASGSGTFTITDVDGDTISGLVSGAWTRVGSSASFSGLISGTLFSSSGTFDGTTDSISTSWPSPPPYGGNLMTLAFGGWFSDSGGTPHTFTNKTTLSSGVIVPAPGAFLLATVGVALVGRIRRHFA